MYWAIGAISLLALGGAIYVLRRKKENKYLITSEGWGFFYY
jgi:LPXTG-motif cell wall-anchored protein